LVCVDCFFVGRLSGTKGSVWQLTAIDVASAYGWVELVSCPRGNPTGLQTSRLARRVASELQATGWRLERILSENGGEFRSNDFRQTVAQLGVHHTLIRAGRPQTNGHVEALHRLILEECWRPAFARYLHPRYTGLRRELDHYLTLYNTDRVHHGRLTNGRIPADIVYGARKNGDEMSRNCRHISERVQPNSPTLGAGLTPGVQKLCHSPRILRRSRSLSRSRRQARCRSAESGLIGGISTRRDR
jgi:hypothetical protein